MNVGHNIIQLGSDPDPSKNFIIRTPPVQDGTLEIRKGTLEAPGALVATFDGNGLVDPREWVDVTANRAFGVTYVNDTGRAIVLSIMNRALPNGDQGGHQVYVNEVGIAGHVNIGAPGIGTLGYNTTTVVPNGATYRVDNGLNAVLMRWMELRLPEGV